jgi:hypothetical protein
MSNYPVTFLKVPPAQDGEYLSTLEQWGDLSQYLTIPDAARFIGYRCKQNAHAIEKIIINAVVTDSLPFAGLKSNGEWEAGMFRLLVDIQGKPRLRPADDGIKFKFAVADIGRLHVEAMGVMVPDVLELLVKRGRKIPEELRHMLPALDATPPTQENQAISAVDRNDSRKRPPLQQAFQESEILRVIGELGYDAKALPKDIPGNPGVKSEVRSKLTFTKTVFDKAWERLSANGEIIKLK